MPLSITRLPFIDFCVPAAAKARQLAEQQEAQDDERADSLKPSGSPSSQPANQPSTSKHVPQSQPVYSPDNSTKEPSFANPYQPSLMPKEALGPSGSALDDARQYWAAKGFNFGAGSTSTEHPVHGPVQPAPQSIARKP